MGFGISDYIVEHLRGRFHSQRVGLPLRKRLRRGQVLAFFSRIPRCVVGLEACATGHYWARKLGALGHEVRLMPAQYVKATSSAISTTPPTPKRFAKPLGDRPCGLCRLRRQSNRQVSCCIEARP
jgi:transposase